MSGIHRRRAGTAPWDVGQGERYMGMTLGLYWALGPPSLFEEGERPTRGCAIMRWVVRMGSLPVTAKEPGSRCSDDRAPPFVAGASAPTRFHGPYEGTTGPSRTKEPCVQLDSDTATGLNGGKPAGDCHELAACGSVSGTTDPSGRRLPQSHQPTRPPQAEPTRV